MFHCNGWCFTWAVTAAGGTHVCLREVDAGGDLGDDRCARASPTSAARRPCCSRCSRSRAAAARLERPVRVAVGGAPPTPSMLERCAEIGLDDHPRLRAHRDLRAGGVCDWRTEWNELPLAEQATLRARQGVANVVGDRPRAWSTSDGARRARRRRDDGRDRAARKHRDARLLPRPGGDRRGRPGRLVPHRRPRRHAPRRLRRDPRPGQGRDHLRRREHLLGRGRGRAGSSTRRCSRPRSSARPTSTGASARSPSSRARGEAEIDSDEVRAWLRGRLAGYKVPDRIEVAELPKTASGKIRKDVLRKRMRDAEGVPGTMADATNPASGAPAVVKSADRTLAILDLLTVHREGLTLVDIHRTLGFPKSSTYSILMTMVGRGFLEQDVESRRFRVGIRLWQAGQSYVAAGDLEAAALPYMEQLRDELNEVVQLATLDGTDNVYLGKVDPDQQLRLASRVGAGCPPTRRGSARRSSPSSTTPRSSAASPRSTSSATPRTRSALATSCWRGSTSSGGAATRPTPPSTRRGCAASPPRSRARVPARRRRSASRCPRSAGPTI